MSTCIKKATESEPILRLSKIDYRKYPEYMFAMISAFLPVNEGDELRRLAGDVIFRHEDSNGRTYKNGLLHSYDDKPASISSVLSTKFWYKNGRRHRDYDFPAIESDKNSEWYMNGLRHREGGLPAVVFKGTDSGYQPACNEWWVNGKRHREGDLPAIQSDTGRLEWWVDGKRHREGDRPAVISVGGYSEWWVNGQFVRAERS